MAKSRADGPLPRLIWCLLLEWGEGFGIVMIGTLDTTLCSSALASER